MENADEGGLTNTKAHIVIELIEYKPGEIVTKTIIKKLTGEVIVTSFDAGTCLKGDFSQYDTYVQILEGSAELTINHKNYHLRLGEGIIIPAYTVHRFNATTQFKMIATLIKS